MFITNVCNTLTHSQHSFLKKNCVYSRGALINLELGPRGLFNIGLSYVKCIGRLSPRRDRSVDVVSQADMSIKHMIHVDFCLCFSFIMVLLACHAL